MGIVCMAMIANLQYGWTLFVDPIDAKYQWGRAAIQLAFTIFVVTETWLVPIEAWFVDKYGPRVVIMFGGVMIALAWVLNSYANSLVLLYIAAIIAGIGAGSVYGTCVGNALASVRELQSPSCQSQMSSLRLVMNMRFSLSVSGKVQLFSFWHFSCASHRARCRSKGSS
jgi:MFS family permease